MRDWMCPTWVPFFTGSRQNVGLGSWKQTETFYWFRSCEWSHWSTDCTCTWKMRGWRVVTTILTSIFVYYHTEIKLNTWRFHYFCSGGRWDERSQLGKELKRKRQLIEWYLSPQDLTRLFRSWLLPGACPVLVAVCNINSSLADESRGKFI